MGCVTDPTGACDLLPVHTDPFEFIRRRSASFLAHDTEKWGQRNGGKVIRTANIRPIQLQN
jgi:hypothetical protein